MKKEEDPAPGNRTLKGRAWFGASRKPRGGWGSMNEGQRSRQGQSMQGLESLGGNRAFPPRAMQSVEHGFRL